MARPEDPLLSITNEIDSLYNGLLGDIGKVSFKSRILPLAKEIVGHEPRLYSGILKQLIMVGVGLEPQERDHFWTNVVSADTFRFQLEFDRLHEPDNRRSQKYVFHINKKELFDNLQNGALIPPYLFITKPGLFDNAYGNPDWNRVNFADGSVDELAVFLAGHALINANNSHEGSEKDDNSPIVPMTYAIGIANFSDTYEDAAGSGEGTEHEILTPYGMLEDLSIDVRDSTQPVQIIATIPIPFTVLLPEQIDNLKAQGRRLFETGATDDNDDVTITTPDAAAQAYQATVHQTLATKFTLQRFIEANG